MQEPVVAAGRLPPGTRLPTVRELAAELTMAVTTVARAYRELELAGVVEKRRTAGTYISATGSPLARAEQERILTEKVDALIAEARHLNFSVEEIVTLVRQRDIDLTPTQIKALLS